MAAVRFSIVADSQCFTRSVFAYDRSFQCRLFGTRWSDVQCDLCGLHAGIDPASPAVVEASL